MEITELIRRSPVRIFEKSIHGGLKPGEIGVIAGPSGVGKTSALVQLALDKLLQSKKVIHVSYTKHTDHVLAWYEDIFEEITRKKNLENINEIKDDLVKNRVLMKFNQEGFSGEQARRSLTALVRDGGFDAEAIFVDGFDFHEDPRERFVIARDLAQSLNISLWYNYTVKNEASAYDSRKIPRHLEDTLDLIDALIVMEPKGDHIALSVSKDREDFNPESLALRLDPKSLLIIEG